MSLIRYMKMPVMLIGFALGLASVDVSAMMVTDVQSAASVDSIVTQVGPNTWQYQFTVNNLSTSSGTQAFLYSLDVPYYPDAGIAKINSPNGWTGEVFSSNNQFLGSPYLIHWSSSSNSSSVLMGESLSGFGYTASFAPVKGPFIAMTFMGQQVNGDPAIPGSPLTLEAGFTTPFPVASVPEPETYAMLLAGLGLMGGIARRRKLK